MFKSPTVTENGPLEKLKEFSGTRTEMSRVRSSKSPGCPAQQPSTPNAPAGLAKGLRPFPVPAASVQVVGLRASHF